MLESAAAGRSNLQRDYRRPLAALGILVVLVLLIACANVANLMTARAAARAREMALRVSIGAGQWRLVQLVLMESAWLAFLATALSAFFAWWTAPLIVGMINPADNPARLALPADWRVLGFALALALGVTFLFGLMPALRASAVKPVRALRGGEDPHSRRRLMHVLIAMQVAFCFVVHFAADMFVASFDHLSKQPTGFSADRVVNLETVVQRPQPSGVVGAGGRAPADGARRGIGCADYLAVDERRKHHRLHIGRWRVLPRKCSQMFLSVSPGWFDTMRIRWKDGRDFLRGDVSSSVAIVNEAFAKQFLGGANPVGKSFDKMDLAGARVRFQIVGFVGDARSRDDLRLPIRPIAYFPFGTTDMGRGDFVVRTSGANPLALASILRAEVPRARSEFRVSNIRSQAEIDLAHTVRERLLATLAAFFAAVALLLAGVGLYGVLDYGVVQRQREFGIRIAIGAQAEDIAGPVTAEVCRMLLAGAVSGIVLGMELMRYIAALFFQVRATDLTMAVVPFLTITATALLAALPAVVRAIRIDPVSMLRAD